MTEYAVDNSLGDVVEKGETKYIVSWYGYSKEENTV